MKRPLLSPGRGRRIAPDVRLVDTYRRAATGLRLPLTGRCNLRLFLRHASRRAAPLPGKESLTADELARLAGIGVRRPGSAASTPRRRAETTVHPDLPNLAEGGATLVMPDR